MAPCPSLGYVRFDVVETAKVYANIAAFLAGFAVTAITVLLAAHIDGPGRRLWDDLGDALKVLLSAFICLVVTAFEYAVQAGEMKLICNDGAVRVPNRLATEELLTGTAFASGVFLLVFAVVLVLDAIDETGWRTARGSDTSPAVTSSSREGRPSATRTSGARNSDTEENGWAESEPARFFRSVLAQFLPVIIVVFLFLGASDYTDAHQVPGVFKFDKWSPYNLGLAVLLLGQLFWNVFLYPFSFRPWRQEIREPHQGATWFGKRCYNVRKQYCDLHKGMLGNRPGGRTKGRKPWKRRTGVISWAALMLVVTLIIFNNVVGIGDNKDHTPAVGCVVAGMLAIWVTALWITKYLGMTSPMPPQRRGDHPTSSRTSRP